MSNLEFPITKKMINEYYLYLKTPYAKKENLYKLWEDELKRSLDLTQRKWITDCIVGKRKMNVYTRHDRQFVTIQSMLKPENQNSKSLEHTLNDMSEEETQDMIKKLKKGSLWSC